MKIVHVCLYGPVTDGWNYQDNMIPKFQVKDGHDVTVVASKWVFNDKGKIEYFDKTNYYYNGIHMIRLDLKMGRDIYSKIKVYDGLYEVLESIKPDCLFVHGVQFVDIHTIVKYAKEYKTKVYVDNHCDFSNSATNWLSKYILHGIIWKHFAKEIEPYTTKFYGVLPARVDFLTNVYKLPKDKCELLVMGVDDEMVNIYDDTIKETVCNELNISKDTFLIVTGGKIDSFKMQTLQLMEAVNAIKDINISLIVFGSVEPKIRDRFNSLISSNVIYIGWINTDLSYKYFSAADLVVFPGRHSVFWEEVAGIGKPMICKFWPGTTHVDRGGNIKFLYDDSVSEIINVLVNVIRDNDEYLKMKDVAKREKQSFSYREISRKCIV